MVEFYIVIVLCNMKLLFDQLNFSLVYLEFNFKEKGQFLSRESFRF